MNNCIRIAAQAGGKEEATREETELLLIAEGIRIATRCMVYGDAPSMAMKEQCFIIVPRDRLKLVIAALCELDKKWNPS